MTIGLCSLLTLALTESRQARPGFDAIAERTMAGRWGMRGRELWTATLAFDANDMAEPEAHV